MFDCDGFIIAHEHLVVNTNVSKKRIFFKICSKKLEKGLLYNFFIIYRFYLEILPSIAFAKDFLKCYNVVVSRNTFLQ